MSLELLCDAWDLQVPAEYKLLLLILADQASPDGTGEYPSMSVMTTRTSMSENNVRRVLDELKMSDLLSNIPGSKNGYQLTIYEGGDCNVS